MNQSGLIALEISRNARHNPNWLSRNDGKLFLHRNIRLFSKKERQAEDEFDALYLNGEVTENSDQESNSETDVEDNLVHQELYRLKPEHKRLYHSSIQPLILIYHKIKLYIIKLK
ncbi:hypothetical protein AVEN_262545-1 [Araneus ventricosus]|uniref:Uncharacterized protein n=1 Tax=Araneus ventricosus TaxID=182803 RepID=A0A4Y2KUZ9_ARAVE|nr:hypothetical protein AVEN_262545-1 [Araneus ventricosus]